MTHYAHEVPEDKTINDEVPEVADDDYPERQRVPEPEEPALPADKPLGVKAVGTTVEEQRQGESLDEKLARERKDG